MWNDVHFCLHSIVNDNDNNYCTNNKVFHVMLLYTEQNYLHSGIPKIIISASTRDKTLTILTCNNLPGWVERLHAGDAHAATGAPWPGAPWPSSAALRTEHAWPGAGEQQTSEERGPGALLDMQLLRKAQIQKINWRSWTLKKKYTSCRLGVEITNQTAGGAASHDHEENR